MEKSARYDVERHELEASPLFFFQFNNSKSVQIERGGGKVYNKNKKNLKKIYKQLKGTSYAMAHFYMRKYGQSVFSNQKVIGRDGDIDTKNYIETAIFFIDCVDQVRLLGLLL